LRSFLQAFTVTSLEILSILILKKTENAISKTDAKEKAGDCLACHFLATGNTLLPDEFSFTLIKHTHEVEQVFAVQEKIWSQTKFSFQLRGPPAIS